MKILVTGGAGFIGSHVVDALIFDGHEVVIIDDLSSGKKHHIHTKAKFYQADIREPIIEDIFEKEQIDVVNHHAAQISVRDSVWHPLHDADINIIGLLNILNISKKFHIKKFVFASSGGTIYGDANIVPTPENYTPLLPLSPYGIAKLAGEYYLSFYNQTFNLDFIALRYSNVYGPRQDAHGEAGVVAIFTQKFLSGDQPIINGDGKQTRDFIYVEDIARANCLAVRKSGTMTLNISTGFGTDIVTIYKKINDITGSHKEPIHGAQKPGEQRQSILLNDLARQKIAWQPKVNLDQGLKKTVEYFKSL